MLNTFKAAWGRNRTVAENFLALSVVQFANYLAPLITVPYLVRVLGPDRFGIVAFVNALILYLTALSDYGFRLSATRRVSVLRQDRQRRDEVFNAVLVIKFAFMILGLVLLLVLLLLVPQFRAERTVYLFAFGAVVGNVFFLDWFFQGMERMKYITGLTLVSRTLFVVAVFVFVKEQADYVYVPLLNSLGIVAVGLASLWIVHAKFGARFFVPGFVAIREELREGWHVFLSVATANIYTGGIPLILGFFAPYASVGYYTAAEKIIQAGTGALEPFTRAVYPHISHLSSKSKEAALSLIRRIVCVVGPLTFLVSLGVVLLAPRIVSIILGAQYRESIPVIRILAFLFFARGLGHLFLLQTMLNFHHDREVFRIVLASALSCVLFSLVLIPLSSHRGAAVAALVPEMTMLFLSAAYVQKVYKVMSWHVPVPGTRSEND